MFSRTSVLPGKKRPRALLAGALAVSLAVLVGEWAVPVSPARAAGWQTFTVTSPHCTGPGSITEIVKEANANPGPDTISFATDVDLGGCPQPETYTSGYYAANITESVTIEGNGHVINGQQSWVDTSGFLNGRNQCPGRNGVIAMGMAPGVFIVGTSGADNSNVNVDIHNLNVKGTSAVLRAYQKSTTSWGDSRFSDIVDIFHECNRGPFDLQGVASFSMSDSTVIRANTPRTIGEFVGTFGGDGDLLTLERVQLTANETGGAIAWGGDANIVSSQLRESGGMFWYGAGQNFNFVNSTYLVRHMPVQTDQIWSAHHSGGSFNITGSTIAVPTAQCRDCTYQGDSMPFSTAGEGAVIRLASSAVQVNESTSAKTPLIRNMNGGAVYADTATWIQPVNTQDAAALKTATNQPNLLTDAPGMPTLVNDLLTPLYPTVATPLLGTPGNEGKLIDAVADAQPGGANQLLNPIDGAPLQQDVFGNPRWDTGNGKRNIGAVQTAQSPHLTLDDVSSGKVRLSWNRPADPTSGPITGYTVIYSPAAGGAEQRWAVPGTGSSTAEITGLTNGTPYQFQVVAMNKVGDGPRSNEVQATPFGPIAPPQITKTDPGNHTVTVTWNPPADWGGHTPTGLYDTLHRKKGDTDWILGTSVIGTHVTFGGLVNGVEYEFGIVATSYDGTRSDAGIASGTPDADKGASVFVPIDPARVYDSRLAGPGGTPNPIPGNMGSRTMQVADAIDITTGQVVQKDIVPAGATAVAFNLTATDTASRGWFSIAPGDASTYAASAVNWTGGSEVIANGLTVKLPAQASPSARTVKVFNGSATPADAVLDIVGYFVDPAVAGNVFHEVTPTRVYDSRTAGPGGTPDPLPGGANRVISVADDLTPPHTNLVPAGATAVAYNISAVDTSPQGWFSVTPGDAATYRSSTVNWSSAGDVIDNGQFVKLDANRQIKVFNGYGPPTNLVVEVLGYFTPSPQATGGNYFYPVDPVRAYDSRAPQPEPGPVPGGATRNVSVADARNLTTGAVTRPDVIPTGAGSIVYNVTATGTTNRGWFSVTPGNVSDRLTASVNWPAADDVVANGLTGAIDNRRTINVRSGSPSQTDLVIDLYGYFK